MSKRKYDEATLEAAEILQATKMGNFDFQNDPLPADCSSFGVVYPDESLSEEEFAVETTAQEEAVIPRDMVCPAFHVEEIASTTPRQTQTAVLSSTAAIREEPADLTFAPEARRETTPAHDVFSYWTSDDVAVGVDFPLRIGPPAAASLIPQEGTASKDMETTKPQPAAVPMSTAMMKVPVPAAENLCHICYTAATTANNDNDTNNGVALAVCCDNGHYICQPCFTSWVESESDTTTNQQQNNILLNRGQITCVRKKLGCNSPAYASKLIAMVVSDQVYEKHLHARDFVVGKEAAASALSKVQGGDMNVVEQEQIRNMYRTGDGCSYSAYMCGQCSFGPIDHGWCSSLSAHHGDKKPGGGSIDNSCPKCHWFTSQISKWPRWDGQFQPPGRVFKPPSVETMLVRQLKAALKSRGAPVSGVKADLIARLQALYDAEAKVSV